MKHLRRVLAMAAATAASVVLAATRYDGDGVNSPRQELQRWYINRARHDPEREADRFGLVNTNTDGHPGYDACEDTDGTNDFGAGPAQWAAWQTPRPPLAPNARLGLATTNHARDMAETQVFSHYSPSANYYPLNSSPGARMTAEGYSWSSYAENICAGFPLGSNCHEAFFIDEGITNRGHRKNVLSTSVREIGVGNAATSTLYRWYDVQDYGRESTNHFFTDTLFHDANTNGCYEEGEGVAGVAVMLWTGTNQSQWYDLSGPSGSFAVPINDIRDGSNVTVQLVNSNAASCKLTLPLDYYSLGEIELAAGEAVSYGRFQQPLGLTNTGFRNVDPFVCGGEVLFSDTNAIVQFSGPARLLYGVESSEGLSPAAWTNFITAVSTGELSEVTDTGQGGRGSPAGVPVRFYRVSVLRQ